VEFKLKSVLTDGLIDWLIDWRNTCTTRSHVWTTAITIATKRTATDPQKVNEADASSPIGIQQFLPVKKRNLKENCYNQKRFFLLKMHFNQNHAWRPDSAPRQAGGAYSAPQTT